MYLRQYVYFFVFTSCFPPDSKQKHSLEDAQSKGFPLMLVPKRINQDFTIEIVKFIIQIHYFLFDDTIIINVELQWERKQLLFL